MARGAFTLGYTDSATSELGDLFGRSADAFAARSKTSGLIPAAHGTRRRRDRPQTRRLGGGLPLSEVPGAAAVVHAVREGGIQTVAVAAELELHAQVRQADRRLSSAMPVARIRWRAVITRCSRRWCTQGSACPKRRGRSGPTWTFRGVDCWCARRGVGGRSFTTFHVGCFGRLSPSAVTRRGTFVATGDRCSVPWSDEHY